MNQRLSTHVVVSGFLLLELAIFAALHFLLKLEYYFSIPASFIVVLFPVWVGGKTFFRRSTAENQVKSRVNSTVFTGQNEVNEKLQIVTRKLRKQVFDLHNLFEVSINLTTILEPQQLIKSSILSLIGQLQTNEAIVFLPSKNNPTLIFPIYSKGFPKEQWKNFSLSIQDPIFQKFQQKMIAIDLRKTDQKLIDERWKKLIDSGISLIAPIILKQEIKGLIALGQKMSQELFTQSEKEIFSLLSHFISVAFSNSILYQKMEQISVTDELTGLFNYRFFKKQLDGEVLRAQRYHHSLSLIMFDVDHFKNYNDTLGHPAGDIALKKIAMILKSTIRKSDLAVRYGGEEFCVILPEEDISGALEFGERLRRKIEEQQFDKEEVQPAGKLTISLGVASFPDDAESTQDLLDKADAALYHAKAQGRNRICRYMTDVMKG
jgi:diguanylate cyclase (GGDEF)-like protein